LNNAYRSEMLMRRVRSSDPNLSLSIKPQDLDFDADAQYGNKDDGDDKVEAETNAPDTLLLHHHAAGETDLDASDRSLFSGVFSRSSSYVGDVVLAPANFIHSTVSALMEDSARTGHHHDDDAMEVLDNRDLDESADSKFMLHLVS